MNIIEILNIVLVVQLIGVVYFSYKTFYRFKLERKLQKLLMKNIMKSNFEISDLSVVVKNQKISISGRIKKKNYKYIKNQLDKIVEESISQLTNKSDQKLIRESIEKSIYNGDSLYKNKIIRNSVETLEKVPHKL